VNDAYGNEDLGNRRVEDQDFEGRTGMVSSPCSVCDFFEGVAIFWRTRFKAEILSHKYKAAKT